VVNGRRLRETLQTRVKTEQANLRKHLYALAIKANKEIVDSLDEIGQSLKKPLSTLEEYVDYIK
jgi:hypothetical protein